MRHKKIPAGHDLRLVGCDCAHCAAARPINGVRLTPADTIALLAIAGFAVGLLLCWLLDRATGGPGIRVMFQ